MARVKKEARSSPPSPDELPVSPDWECGLCEPGAGEVRVTPDGQHVCSIHSGGIPLAAKGSRTANRFFFDDAPGKALADVIAKSEREDAERKAREFVGGYAPEKPIDERVSRLVSTTFAPVSWDGVFDEFDKWMELGDNRTSEHFIRVAHEKGPAIVRKLYAVYLQVREARESWELRNAALLGSMREQANDLLQAEKNKGVRSKQITEADIDKKTAQMFPDEHAEQETRRLRYKLVEDRAKHEVEVATLRCRILDTMMTRLRAS